jgi:hypothetical protein
MIRTLLTSMGGRTWLSGIGFSVVAMVAATGLVFKVPETFNGGNWVAALGICATLLGANVAKRSVEEYVTRKNGGK